MINTPPRVRGALKLFGFALLLPIASLGSLLTMMVLPGAAILIVPPVLLTGFILLLRKKLSPAVSLMYGIIAGIVILGFTILLLIAKGNVDSVLMSTAISGLSLLLPGYLMLPMIADGRKLFILLAVLGPVLAFFLSAVLQKEKRREILKRAWPFLAAGAVCIAVSAVSYANRPSVRYAGHGFDYMNGYSSTDLTPYAVWTEPSKLAQLDHPASLIIENEKEMPRLDGAEACFPVYSAVAKAVYKDIGAIERAYRAKYEDKNTYYGNGRIVGFTNTVNAYWRLLKKDTDIFFGARPSREQMEMAKERNIALKITPIGKEAFVFFVEPDNPVTDLTSEQIKRIYSGEITNWSEVGGKNQKILAFQRPENSGSQAMMEYFMGNVPLKEPESYEYVDSMMGVIRHVAQYANEKGAFGYSFRYFVEDLNTENDVRLLAVDGVLPTRENIKNGSYPLTVDLVAVTREGDPNPNVEKMLEFLLSEDGQELIEKTGYAPARQGG